MERIKEPNPNSIKAKLRNINERLRLNEYEIKQMKLDKEYYKNIWESKFESIMLFNLISSVMMVVGLFVGGLRGLVILGILGMILGIILAKLEFDYHKPDEDFYNIDYKS